MNIVKDNYVLDNINDATIQKVNNTYQGNEFLKIGLNQIHNIFNKTHILPAFRLSLLNDNEDVIADISSDFITGSLSVTYQSGKRRTLNATLLNRDGRYTPELRNSDIYIGCKFKLDAGVIVFDNLYWFPQGTFVLQSCNFTANDSDRTISLNLHDKFAIFDETIKNNVTLKTIVPVGVPMRQAFINILGLDNGLGRPYDNKPIIFNSEYINQLTYKTIKQDYNSKLGDILIDSGNTISSDVYYNVYGNLTVESKVKEFMTNNFPVVYKIEDYDRILYDKSLSYNWDKLRNKIVIKGAITNGYQFSAIAENTNLKSKYNIKNSKCGVRAEVIRDENLYSDILCKEKAMYELVERQRGVTSLSLSMGYIPFFDVNQSILINLSEYGLFNANYVIDDINMNISSEPNLSLTLSNAEDVMFND